jgi:ferritin-like metal-binding protein YciE
MAKDKELKDLFLDTLKDIYFAEKKILSSLPKMAKAAQSDELRATFEKHEGETHGQVERLGRSERLANHALPSSMKSIFGRGTPSKRA